MIFDIKIGYDYGIKSCTQRDDVELYEHLKLHIHAAAGNTARLATIYATTMMSFNWHLK